MPTRRVRVHVMRVPPEGGRRPSDGWMLSVAKLAVGQERYYLEAAGDRVDAAESVAEGREDYYLDPSEARGRWAGAGAAQLGLAGDVSAEQLRRLLAGAHPTKA